MKILSAQGIKSRNQKIHLTGDRQDDALPGRVSAAMWARAHPGFRPGLPPAPLSPGAYKYPQGSSVGRYLENRVVFVTLLLGIVVVVSFFF